ncbi:fez family zinc finger protein 2-like [Toxorhynchites rutilus septentrionalis]|uniref:fez family zinc finger protein 2-like n=1 Tax=Toxorhynchites rutilus septentrionalis TaxID=329112 RepID=UPI0024784F20|nr:fez family zinc finger protein 2-like [Toxorhynchites rutilus septentrionalis]
MITNSLGHFPDVCCLCLRIRPAPEMIPIDGTQPEFDLQLSDMLEEFSFAIPTELSTALPAAVCEQCEKDFLLAYKLKRRVKFLRSFQIAYLQMKLGNIDPLRTLFNDHHVYMGTLFRELNLISNDQLCWKDLEESCTKNHIKQELLDNEETDFNSEDNNQILEVEILQSNAELSPDHPYDIEIEYLEFDNDKSSDKNSKSEESISCDLNHTEQKTQNEWLCKIGDCQYTIESRDLLVRHKNEVHHCCVCDICGIVLKNKYSLDVHVRRHRGETRFDCEYCPSSFHTSQEHKLHLGLVHVAGEYVKCDICGLGFRNSVCLKRHLKSHSNVRNYKCPHCDMAFKTTMHLHRHKETVHMKVRYNCDHCDMSYGRKDKLRMHVERVHNIQTYFLCSICLKSFPSNDNLEEHMNYHANPKELECAVCLVAYLSQDDFDTHLCISYREDYVCCGRDFKFHTFYNKHMFLVHGEKTNVRVRPAENKLLAKIRAERKQEERCSNCEKVFISRKLKNIHRKTCCGVSPLHFKLKDEVTHAYI